MILRNAFADAQRDGLVGRNVAALARPPRQVHREVEYLDPPSLRRLMDASKDHALVLDHHAGRIDRTATG